MDISEIFQKYSPQYLKLYGKKIPDNHRRAIFDILNCRTPVMGGKVYFCEKCGEHQYSYHSCKNRHCPKCGSRDSEKWLNKQKKKLLPVQYFMVTFTLPAELRSICRSNQKIFYSAIFKASSTALRTLLKDPKYAGGEAGFTGVLHTWTRQLNYHSHIHYIVPAGAFDFKRNEWNKANHKYLIPVKVLSILFRKNLQRYLQTKAPQIYCQIPQNIWREKEFITNSIPVGTGEKAFTYLANYVYKTAITNNRIISCENGKVTFKYKESGTNVTKILTIPAMKFMRRFLQHVLPSRFQKVRYYGFLSSASKAKWEKIADYFDVETEEIEQKQKSAKICKERLCPHCHSKMIEYASILRRPRSPPNKRFLNLIKKASFTD